MVKTLIGLIGILLFITSLLIGNNLKKNEKLASTLDDEKHAYGMIGDGPLPCTWDVKSPERVMSENKSQAIVVDVSNTTDEKCESTLTLRAPGFDMSPAEDNQTISLEKTGKGSLSWILIPRKTGSFELAVSDILNTKIFGITVTNIFGLSAPQAKIFSIAGGLFGPMFTIPWWMEKLWNRRKQKQEVRKDREEIKDV